MPHLGFSPAGSAGGVCLCALILLLLFLPLSFFLLCCYPARVCRVYRLVRDIVCDQAQYEQHEACGELEWPSNFHARLSAVMDVDFRLRLPVGQVSGAYRRRYTRMPAWLITLQRRSGA